jgi:predicted dehydrogenase
VARKIHVGIVGVGGIAQHQHLPGYFRCEDVEITALCDINEDLLKSVGEKYGVSYLTTEYHELVELGSLDAVDICTSPNMHHPVAMAAIEQGRHVFCEKPLALNYKQARQMHEAAEAAGLKTGVGFVHRVTPAARLAHQILSAGDLGDIYHVIAIFSSGSANFADRPMSWRKIKANAGAGPLFDLASHMVDMTRWWLGQEITAVCAQTRIFVRERRWPESDELAEVETDDASTFLADFEGGAMGTFINSNVFTGRGFDQRVEVYGSRGAILYDQARPCALRVCIGQEMLQLSSAWGIGRRKEEPYPIMPVAEELKDRWTPDELPQRTLNPDFIAAIRGQDAFLPTFHDGMKVQEVLEAALISAETGRWVKLPLPIN